MKVTSLVRAARRIRRVTGVAAAGALLVSVGCWVAVTAPRHGLLTVLVGLVILHAAIRQRQDLVLLQTLTGRTVGEIAEGVPVLRHYGSRDGIAEFRRLSGRDIAAVPTDDGWKILTSADVADAVLAAADRRFSGDWSRYLRSVPTLGADLPVDRLRRLPQGPERWLVTDGMKAPRVITAGTLLRAARKLPPLTPERSGAAPTKGAARPGRYHPSS